jgi:acylphosphatase
MSVECKRILYRGRVQGVGFRYTAQRLAHEVGVAGTVRNLDDGSVEVVAEGEAHLVSEFLDAISRAMGDKIHEARVHNEPVGQNRFAGFSALY